MFAGGLHLVLHVFPAFLVPRLYLERLDRDKNQPPLIQPIHKTEVLHGKEDGQVRMWDYIIGQYTLACWVDLARSGSQKDGALVLRVVSDALLSTSYKVAHNAYIVLYWSPSYVIRHTLQQSWLSSFGIP